MAERLCSASASGLPAEPATLPGGLPCWIGLGVENYPYGLLTMIVSVEAIFLSTRSWQ
jgi:hypothetical protein